MGNAASAQNENRLSIDGRALYGKVQRRIIPLFLLCYLIAYLDRVNVGFAKLQMLSDLHMNEAAYGLGAGLFFLGYVLFEIPSNAMMLRVGPRVWITRIMISWGVVSVLTMFSSSAIMFYVLRALLGVCEAGFIPATLYYLSIWFPSSYRGKTAAVFLAGIPLSGIIGGPLSGTIMTALDQTAGLAGWQWLYLLEGVPAIIVGIVCFRLLSNDIEHASWLNAMEKWKIKDDVQRENREKLLHSAREGLFNPRIWLLSITYFCLTMGLYGLSFWLPSIIKESGVESTFTIGLLSAIPNLGALIAMILVGLSSDRSRERRWHLAIPAIVGAVGLVFSVVYVHNTGLAIAALTVASMGVVTCIPQFYSLLPSVVSGSAAAMGLALANSTGSLSGFVSPYLIGIVKTLTGSTDIGVMVLAAVLIIGAVLVFANPAHLVNR